MNRIFRIIAIIAVALTSMSVRAEEPLYLRWVGAADDAVARQDWDRAQECYREAMRTRPDNPNNVLLLANMGMVQHYAGEDSLALETLTQAHVMAPRSVTILNNRATVLSSLGRTGDAIGDYSQTLQIDSVNATALFNRGYLLMIQGDSIGAENDMRNYEKATGDSLNAAASLAVLYSNIGRPEKAIPEYNRLIAGRPTANAYAARAMCYLIMGKLPEASEDIAEGLRLDATNGELYFCRAYLNRLRYREEDAKADARLAALHGVEKERIEALMK